MKWCNDNDCFKFSVYDKVLGLLVCWEQFWCEFKCKLGQGGYELDEVDVVFDCLGEQCYQDDEWFVGMLVCNCVGQGYGLVCIWMELKIYGVDDVIVWQLLEDVEVDWYVSVVVQLCKCYGGKVLVDFVECIKWVQFFLCCGFFVVIVCSVIYVEVDDVDDD